MALALACPAISHPRIFLSHFPPPPHPPTHKPPLPAHTHFLRRLRSGNAANNTAQDAWPLRLKRSRMIPAVEYVQASRMRGILVAEYLKATASVDVFVGGAGSFTTVGNLANFPQMSIPYNFTTPTEPVAYAAWNNATSPRRLPQMIGIYGAPYKDAEVCGMHGGMGISQRLFFQRGICTQTVPSTHPPAPYQALQWLVVMCEVMNGVAPVCSEGTLHAQTEVHAAMHGHNYLYASASQRFSAGHTLCLSIFDVPG